MDDESQSRTPGERDDYVLGAEIDTQRVQHGLRQQIRNGEKNVSVSHGGYPLVLAAPEKDALHVEPEKGNGHGGAEQDHDHSL